uniref:Ig-like domain-containing protein n=1 Tax=Terrapene triunguis TaxID=2587831 RepID=A0A674IAJ2_9SAUR
MGEYPFSCCLIGNSCPHPITYRPAAPSISATAGGPWNDSVTIACSLPRSYMSTTFQILKNGHLVLLESTPSSQGVRLQLHTADPDISGSYTCSYEIDISGRKMQSNLSSPFSIHLPGD